MSINYQLFDVPPHSRDVGSPVAGTVETLDELKEKLIAGVELGLDWAIINIGQADERT